MVASIMASIPYFSHELRAEDAVLIRTTNGPTGGYSLIKAPGQISLHDIIIIMEGEAHIRQRPVPEWMMLRNL